MGKPVKVSSELYEALRQTAEQQHIPIQDALKQAMEGRENEIRQLQTQKSQLEKQLQSKGRALQLKAKASNEALRRVTALKSDLQTTENRLHALANERDDLTAHIEQQEQRTSDLEAQIRETQQSADREKKRHQKRLIVLAILALVGVGYTLWMRWNQVKQRKEKTEQAPLQPGFYSWL